MNKRKILIGLSLLILFTSIFPYNFSTSQVAANGEQLFVKAEKLYLREGPGLSYPVLETLKEGTELLSIKKEGDWQHVKYGEMEGWVAAWLVKSADNRSAAKSEKTVIAQVNDLNLRAGPSLSSPVLTKLSSGTESKFLHQEQDWIQIQNGDLVGWVFEKYVTIKEETILETPSTPSNNNEESNVTPQQFDPNTFTINVNAVNIRKKPDLTAKKLGVATNGQQFKVISRDHNWVEIEYKKGAKGWIYSFYGTFTKQLKSEQSSKKEQTNNFVTVIYNGTNLRESASTSSNVVTRADAGNTYPIIDNEGDWYKIALNDERTAYVANWVVTENNNATGQTSQNHENQSEDRKKGTLKGVTIVLDAGHGGNDRGTTGVRGTDEKDINIMTTELLRSKLQAAGANVVMTRESDVFVDLRKRVAVSHQTNADAFISIHYDAIEDSSVNGFTTYYTNSYQQELAEYVHAGLASKVDLKDRGARFGDYLVLRENRQNAILLELGYLSNPSEERAITTDYYREQATLGIYQGLLNYFDAQLEM
ncbi:N-acetylmuramoyl-L-alanine amidase [Solibacillus sp. FSL W8-0474]|uniref:N-acetylmuramoyl-L-alanine amidase n=1 Tax=Solibacillus sp. FSL W8-0474 TaxID=2975336 RepID=UPI0030FBD27C